MGKSRNKEDYQVGVFKNGSLKKMMKLSDGHAYIKAKQKKLKSQKPKRDCSDAQLAALAKGRSIREKNKQQSAKPKQPAKLTCKAPSLKNAHRAQDRKGVSQKKKAIQHQIRKDKELETGQHRKGGDGAYYQSDSDGSPSLRQYHSGGDYISD
jgi:hypothetical protein